MTSKDDFAKDFETIFKIKVSEHEQTDKLTVFRQGFSPTNDKNIITSDRIDYMEIKKLPRY